MARVAGERTQREDRNRGPPRLYVRLRNIRTSMTARPPGRAFHSLRLLLSLMNTWTTRIDSELTAPYGVKDVHSAWFYPADWPGRGSLGRLAAYSHRTHR
jgi:hypothetical protein